MGEVFNVACNEQTTLNEVYRQLQGLLGTDVRPMHGPPRAGDVRHSLADIAKARRLLGYGGGIKLGEGLRMSIVWYRENL